MDCFVASLLAMTVEASIVIIGPRRSPECLDARSSTLDISAAVI
jgi:hypothetical protein